LGKCGIESLKLASVHSIPLNVKVSGIYSTPRLIIRLESSSGWLTIDVWLGLQMEYDLAEAENVPARSR
jgi:hypothetical protein